MRLPSSPEQANAFGICSEGMARMEDQLIGYGANQGEVEDPIDTTPKIPFGFQNPA